MSAHTEHEHAGHGHGVRSEEDRISTSAIVGVGVASLVVFLVASLITAHYWRARRDANGPYVVPAEVGLNKIGMVEQQMFSGSRPFRGDRQRAAKLERLSSYGWVDQSAGIAHLPITDAMSLVEKGIRPMPVVPPEVPSQAPPGGQP